MKRTLLNTFALNLGSATDVDHNGGPVKITGTGMDAYFASQEMTSLDAHDSEYLPNTVTQTVVLKLSEIGVT